jgi:hypothetical protein
MFSYAAAVLVALVGAAGLTTWWTAPGSAVRRSAYIVAVVIAVLIVDNRGSGNGYALTISLFLLCGASLLLAAASRTSAGLVLFRHGFGLLLAFLAFSGVYLLCAPADIRAFDIKRLHATIGFAWVPFMLAACLQHVPRYRLTATTSGIRLGILTGYVAMAVLLVGAFGGVAHLHFGAESRSGATWLHLWSAVGCLVFSFFHVSFFRSDRPGRTEAPRPRLLRGSTIVWLGLTGLAALLTLISWPRREERRLGETVLTPQQREATLSNPFTGIAAATVDGNGMSEDLLVGDTFMRLSCGAVDGCHPDIRAQWEVSGHRWSVNPAYVQVVSELIDEEGTESARLCATCHDPVPLLAGKIGRGHEYPTRDSPGVTCVVCHSVSATHPETGPARYRLDPKPHAAQSIGDPFTAYMMVRDDIETHRSEWGVEVENSRICAGCHSLTLGDVVLRSTYEEWHRGPHGPASKEPKKCIDCHMPETGPTRFGGFMVHDHRFLGGNVGVTALAGEPLDDQIDFVRQALELEVSTDPTDDGATMVRVRLHNKGVGHGFPAGPRDLVAYWLEARWQGQPDDGWKRLLKDDLFAQSYFDADDRRIERHEIWRVARVEGPESIAPRGVREIEARWTPPPAPGRPLEVRLMHQRFNDTFPGRALLDSPMAPVAVKLMEASSR